MRSSSAGRIRVSEEVEGAANSVPLMTGDMYPITVVCIPGGSTAKIQYTTSPESEVEADSALWRDWEAGEVTETTESVFDGPMTALRLVNVSGSEPAKWEVVA